MAVALAEIDDMLAELLSQAFRDAGPESSVNAVTGGARSGKLEPGYDERGRSSRMAQLDWSQCPAVESIPGKVSGAWVLRDTRMPISVIFENLEYGASIEEIIENYNVTREQVQAVLEFAAQSAAPPPSPIQTGMANARPL